MLDRFTLSMTWSIFQKRFARLVLYVIGVAIIIIIVLPFPASRAPARVASSDGGHYLHAIRNATLGVSITGILSFIGPANSTIKLAGRENLCY